MAYLHRKLFTYLASHHILHKQTNKQTNKKPSSYSICMFMNYLHTKCHTSSFDGSSVITATWKDKYRFHTAIVLIHTLQQFTLTSSRKK